MKLNVNINAQWPVKVGIVAVKKSNYAAITFLEVMQRQFLTLFTLAYFGISGTGGRHILPPLSILGLGGVRVPILFWK